MKMFLCTIAESEKSFDCGSLKWPNFRMKLFVMGHCGVINGPEVVNIYFLPSKLYGSSKSRFLGQKSTVVK